MEKRRGAPGVTAKTAAVVAALSLAGAVSCATRAALYKKVDEGVYAARYEQALQEIAAKQESASPLYSKQNALLFYLDRGMIEHYAGQYVQSSLDLQEGERLIEEAYTRSVTQEIGTFILNDNTRDYAGEDYEDVYINVFNALNYYHRGDLEGALVEARRSNEKLALLSDKYAEDVARVNAGAGVASGAAPSGAVRFSNSALARYLSAVFYRGNGMEDDARIDLDEVKKAYKAAPAIYTKSPPAALEGELDVPAGKARLNVVAFAGFSPVKEEQNVFAPLPFPAPNNMARLALPRLVLRNTKIDRVEAALGGGDRFALEPLEDMAAVAVETFKARYALVFAKTLARSVAKAGASAAVGYAVSGVKEDWAAQTGALLRLLGQGYALISEQADVRAARYFPGLALIAGVNLDPGAYTVTVNFYTGGALVDSVERQIVLAADRPNIVEAVSLK